MSDLGGKVCVVTGGTQGIGEAIARLFAEHNASAIVTCGRQTDAGEKISRGLQKDGTDAVFVTADLTNVEDCFKVVDIAGEKFGRIDIVINVAGIFSRGTLEDTTPSLYDQILAINTRAPFFIMQRAVPLMRRAGRGSIVNISSIAAYGGVSIVSAYATSKAALNGLTKNAAQSLRFDKIRVNSLNVGWTATPGEEKIQRESHGRGDNWLEEVSEGMPFGRLLLPEEVARATMFLASDESGIMTGSVVDYDQVVIGPLG